MHRVNRSTTHQTLRAQLASVVSELKRDYHEMDSADIAYDLGYIGALTYAIKVEVQNTMTWGHEHDTLSKDVQQTNLLLVRLNERVS